MRRDDPGFPGKFRFTGRTGLTFIELMISVTVVGIIAVSALSMAETGVRHAKELELKAALRQIRNAIDRYYEKALETNPHYDDIKNYPKNLEELVHCRILRKIPEDPFTGKADYRLISSTDEPGSERTNEDNVYEVRSVSDYVALDNSNVSEW